MKQKVFEKETSKILFNSIFISLYVLLEAGDSSKTREMASILDLWLKRMTITFRWIVFSLLEMSTC